MRSLGSLRENPAQGTNSRVNRASASGEYQQNLEIFSGRSVWERGPFMPYDPKIAVWSASNLSALRRPPTNTQRSYRQKCSSCRSLGAIIFQWCDRAWLCVWSYVFATAGSNRDSQGICLWVAQLDSDGFAVFSSARPGYF